MAGSRRLGRNVLSRIGMCFLKSLTCCFSKDYSKCLEKMLESCDNKDKLEKEGTKERSAEAGASLSHMQLLFYSSRRISKHSFDSPFQLPTPWWALESKPKSRGELAAGLRGAQKWSDAPEPSCCPRLRAVHTSAHSSTAKNSAAALSRGANELQPLHQATPTLLVLDQDVGFRSA